MNATVLPLFLTFPFAMQIAVSFLYCPLRTAVSLFVGEGVFILSISSKPDKSCLFSLLASCFFMSFILSYSPHIVVGFSNMTQYLDQLVLILFGFSWLYMGIVLLQTNLSYVHWKACTHFFYLG